jgi:acyl-coenzyme A synthetase/AMP-(fatty) acid ligase
MCHLFYESFFISFILGEAMKPKEWTKFTNSLSSFNVRFFVLYGMSECNGVLGCYLLDISDKMVPMGHPLPGVRCMLISEQGQVVNHLNSSSDVGEIHIGGK